MGRKVKMAKARCLGEVQALPDHVEARGVRCSGSPANRCGGADRSLKDDLDEVAGFQLLVGLEAIQYLESFNLMIERRHSGRK